MVATNKTNKTTRMFFTCLFLLKLLLLSGNAQAAVSSFIDRNTIYTGDTFVLTISASGKQNTSPDLSPLEQDFKILGTGKSTQLSINNGKRTDSSSWTIKLQAKRNGTLTIPAIRIGADSTKPLTITITDIPEEITARMAQHFFIEVEADIGSGSGTDSVYVQQQIPFTVRFFYDNSIVDGELSPPFANNAVIETLGRDKNYTTNKNGKTFKVLERNYAISPEKSGELNIEPIQFRGKMRIERARQNNRSRQNSDDLIDRMFNDNPFANDPFFNRQPTQPVSSRSKSIIINVLPRAAKDSASNWIPAEELTLEDSWNTDTSTASKLPSFKTGEPVTRTITITTRGLSASQLPELEIKAPGNTKMYTDEPQAETRTDGKTLYGINKLIITYIPEAAGKLIFPEIKIDWWNTKTNKQDSTILPALEVNVAQGSIAEPAPTISGSKQPDTKEAATSKNATPKTSTTSSIWSWLIWSLAIISAAIFLLQIFRKLIKPALQKKRLLNPTINPNTSFQQFRLACENHLAREAASTLLEHAQALWPQQSPRSLRELASILASGTEEVLQLDQHLYGLPETEWSGQALWESLKNGLQRKVENSSPQKNQKILKPLYPD